MSTITREEWNKKIMELPDDVRAIILNNDNKLNDDVEALCAKYGLDAMLAGSVTRLTIKLLMGFLAPTEFIAKLCEGTGVEREKAAMIAQEINRDILNPIKDSLRKIHNLASGPQAAPLQQPPAASAASEATPTQPASAAQAMAPVEEPPKPGILEQKLMGAFHTKSENVLYTDPKAKA